MFHFCLALHSAGLANGAGLKEIHISLRMHRQQRVSRFLLNLFFYVFLIDLNRKQLIVVCNLICIAFYRCITLPRNNPADLYRTIFKTDQNVRYLWSQRIWPPAPFKNRRSMYGILKILSISKIHAFYKYKVDDVAGVSDRISIFSWYTCTSTAEIGQATTHLVRPISNRLWTASTQKCSVVRRTAIGWNYTTGCYGDHGLNWYDSRKSFQ